MLIERGEQLRDLPLPKGVVQDGVDGRRRTAQLGSDIPIDLQHELGGGRLMIARQVDDLRQFPECTLNDRCPLVELGEVNVTQRCRNS